MQEYPGRKATDQYLAQRIQGASSEQLAAMLLEGAQRFLNLTLQAMNNRDPLSQGRYLGRTSDIIFGLKERLNHEEGGDLVDNLDRIYDWWMHELYEGSLKSQPERLQRILTQMGEFKSTWEELHRRKTSGGPSTPTAGALDGLSI